MNLITFRKGKQVKAAVLRANSSELNTVDEILSSRVLSKQENDAWKEFDGLVSTPLLSWQPPKGMGYDEAMKYRQKLVYERYYTFVDTLPVEDRVFLLYKVAHEYLYRYSVNTVRFCI